MKYAYSHNEHNKVDTYLRFMRNWDVDSKKDLIVKLTASINNQSGLSDLSECFGAWEDSRTAEEIIKEIESERVNKQDSDLSL